MNQVMIVAAGGAIGSVLRYFIQRLFLTVSLLPFPFGTFLVNILGCFVIGLFWGARQRSFISDEMSLFLMTGICGGFTTFSAFSSESVILIHENRFGSFLLYVTLSVVLGLVATYLGHNLTK